MADPVKKSLKKDEWRLMCSNVTVNYLTILLFKKKVKL
jgi:hypothetical protein